jgi:desulfoferrodoxin-like iron-binding protein
MLAEGTTFRCQTCQSEVEVLNAGIGGGTLVCCELEMKKSDDEFEKLWEHEAYDEMDDDWN